MTLTDIARLRLHSQQLLHNQLETAKEVVAYMGAMQSQDYAMSKWAIGLRMKDGTEKAVDKAIDKGEILRTHVLRPTWHLVSARDIYWMLELTGPRIKNSMKSRNKELGLSEAVYKKSNRLLEKAFAKDEHLTREELLENLSAAKLTLTENRAAHLLFHAELDGILCSGAAKAGKRTYALLEQRVPKKPRFTKEESLARLAGIYFKSRGPATIHDFTWWSGLSPADARKGLEMVSKDLQQITLASHTYWFSDKVSVKKTTKSNALLVPAFDELIISYKDRTASIHTDHQKRTFSSNGIFWPTVVINGQVTGLWKRSVKKDKVLIETEAFQPHSSTVKSLLKHSAKLFGEFLNKEPEILFPH